jgi:hypothetical protein
MFLLTIGMYSDTPLPSLAAEGAWSGPACSRGEGTAPAPVGARQALSPARETDPIVPGVSSATPPALRPERPWRAEKAWNGDLQTPCGSAGEARLCIAAPSRRSLTPHPVPDTRANNGAWAPLTPYQQRTTPPWTRPSSPPRSSRPLPSPTPAWEKVPEGRMRADARHARRTGRCRALRTSPRALRLRPSSGAAAPPSPASGRRTRDVDRRGVRL